MLQNIKAISIAFPFMTFLCIPARLFFLPKLFAGWELCLLDGEEDHIIAWAGSKEDSIRGFKLNNDQTGEISVASDIEASMPERVSVMDDISV